MHDANLRNGIREDRLDGFRETLQAVHTADENVPDPTIIQFRQNREPELRSSKPSNRL